jgi:hypothetical protein
VAAADFCCCCCARPHPTPPPFLGGEGKYQKKKIAFSAGVSWRLDMSVSAWAWSRSRCSVSIIRARSEWKRKRIPLAVRPGTTRFTCAWTCLRRHGRGRRG